MAFRIGDYVVRGHIDSSVKGQVTGELEINGKTEPIILNLQGNPHPDLAGCILQFEQKKSEPIPDDLADCLYPDQNGNVGDMSAAQKRKILTIPMDEFEAYYKAKKPMPYVWKNIIYLEWFSMRNGRVVIEGVDYDWEIDLPRWQMTEEDIIKQGQANDEALGGFMDMAVDAFHDANKKIREDESKIDPNADDEFAWERRLQESDKRADALSDLLDQFEDPEQYGEALEKALDSPKSADWELREDFGDNAEDDGSFDMKCTTPSDEMEEEETQFWEKLETAADAVLDFYKVPPEGEEDSQDPEQIGEILSLGVKSKTIASLVLESEGIGHPVGHLIALAKREIARSQKLLDSISGKPDSKKIEPAIWNLRDHLVQATGRLRKSTT